MEYLKLIALKIDDFESTIHHESNYGLGEIEKVKNEKLELEKKGCFCVVLKKPCDVTIK